MSDQNVKKSDPNVKKLASDPSPPDQNVKISDPIVKILGSLPSPPDQNVKISDPNVKEDFHSCPTCYKVYSSKSHLTRHLRAGCLGKVAPHSCSACQEVFKSRAVLHYHRKHRCPAIGTLVSASPTNLADAATALASRDREIEVLRQRLHELTVSAPGSCGAPVVSVQGDHNHVAVQQIHIQIAAFGSEDEERAKAALMKAFAEHPHRLERRLTHNPEGVLGNVVRMIHFNTETPQNWNIRQHKPSNKYVHVWNTGNRDWDQRLRDEIYTSLVTSCIGLLEEVCAEIGCGPDSIEDVICRNKLQKHLNNKLEEAILNGTRELLDWVVHHSDQSPEGWRKVVEVLRRGR